MAGVRLSPRVLALTAACMAAFPVAALAAPSSYDQYVPFTPSASGPTAPGGHSHGRGTGSVPLTPAASRRLSRVDPGTRALLQQIATSPALGAVPIQGHLGKPGTAVTPGAGQPGTSAGQSPGSSKTQSSPSLSTSPSAFDAAGDQLGANPLLPLIIVAALATAVLVAIMRRRRAAQ